MANATSSRPTESFLRAFRRHVLSPLTIAPHRVEEELAEVSTEIEAFEGFADRLEECAVGEGPTDMEMGPAFIVNRSSADSMASVRAAYRGTVTEVPHYNKVYGEPLLENVATELGPDLAQCLAPENSVEKTDEVVTALSQATAQAVHQRRTFSKCLNEEGDSITGARSRLTDLVGELDSLTIPDWYQETFVARLDSIAEDRQNVIRAHPAPASSEEPDLCDYLYEEEPWTYPVLTAVTRLREIVVLS